MKNKQPIVSVIIPTFKRSEYLIRAIKSVLNQTYEPIEIIVVDDNDSDSNFREQTKMSLRSYINSKAIIYIEHDLNKGLSAARNTGIKASTGEFVAFLDDDDEFLPDKTTLQIECFQNNSMNVGLVYGSFIRYETEFNTERVIKPKYSGEIQSILGVNQIGPPSMVMCRKEAVVKVNGFDEAFRSREDIDFYYRVAKHYKVQYIKDVIMKYYIHPNTMSKIHTDKLTYMIRFIDKYGDELKTPSTRWSEIQERLGELNAVNGNVLKANMAFARAYINTPKRIVIIAKAFLSLLGSSTYKKYRKIS